MTVSDRRGAGLLAFLVGIFFASGFSALLYQVIWQRVLALFSGADVFSVTIIVAAFMGGLGAGNLAGGHLADRVSRATCLLLFAGAELAIAAFALVSRALYYDVLYQRAGEWALPLPLMGAILFVSLLWPTFFMGLSLPLLARGLTFAIDQASRVIGSLYGWNTLGAAVGAFATPWLLLRSFDFDTCLQIGAGVNAACALAVLAARHRLADRSAEADARPAALDSSELRVAASPVFALGTWLAIYALSGAIALSLEIAWFRVLGVITKSTSFTFGTLLGMYLTGIALGSIVGARAASQSTANPARRFLLIQTGVTVYALAALAALHWYVGANMRDPTGLAHFLRALEPLAVSKALEALASDPIASITAGGLAVNSPGLFLVLYVVIPFLLITPSTFAMGLSFPWLQRAVQTDARWLGRRVGWLQTANIAGSLAGSLVTGFVLLPLIGSGGTFRILAFAAIVFPILARSANASYAQLFLSVALLASTAAALPRGNGFWARLHGVPPQVIHVEEDASGVSALFSLGPERSVVAGGAEVSTIPFGAYDGLHTLLGAIPVLLHPAPKRVAVIGLGSGDTLYAAASRSEVEEVIGIEILGSQLDLLHTVQRTKGYGGLAALFGDSRVRIEIADGRTFLRRDPRPYDVIEADALRPSAAYSGNLYSKEYFEQIGESLAPGGIAVTWTPTARVADTLLHCYSHVLLLGTIGIASNSPIAFDRSTLEHAAAAPAVRAHFARADIDIVALLERYLAEGPIRVVGPGDPRPPADDLNSDLFPRDEFLSPQVAP